MSGFPFLSLTREIRDMIYRQCLVVPFLIVPHPTHEERRQSELPLTALLAVSKQVRAGKCTLETLSRFQVPRRFRRYALAYDRYPAICHLHTIKLTLSSNSRSSPYLVPQEFVETSTTFDQGRPIPYGGALALSLYRFPSHWPRRTS